MVMTASFDCKAPLATLLFLSAGPRVSCASRELVELRSLQCPANWRSRALPTRSADCLLSDHRREKPQCLLGRMDSNHRLADPESADRIPGEILDFSSKFRLRGGQQAAEPEESGDRTGRRMDFVSRIPTCIKTVSMVADVMGDGGPLRQIWRVVGRPERVHLFADVPARVRR